MPDNERHALREALAGALREAGEIALVASKRPLKRWTKHGASPVSEADIAVNDFLAARLPPLAPDAGWLSEETEDNTARLDAASLWIVDPIDGTRAYLDGKPDWSISVALVENGRPVIGGIYAPVTDELFLAAAGDGATVNGARIRADLADTLNGARLAGPQSHLRKLVEINPRLLPQPKIHSLALRLARVAQGDIDAALASRNSRDWDLAAADLLVHEAGGAMTDFEGRPPVYNRPNPVHAALIAAGAARHAAVLELLRDRRGEFV
ncbi:MAG: 3'(2'),5'-bisphosphate nucleotidase CysQ [Pseudolabrys sp.]